MRNPETPPSPAVRVRPAGAATAIARSHVAKVGLPLSIAGLAWRASTWVAVHLLLGVLLRANPAAATAHGVLVAGAALLAGVAGRLQTVASVIIYVAASQVLWRMSDAALPHMLGMYAVIAAAGLAALRRGRWPSLLALTYVLPLLPSVIITFTAMEDWDRARQLVASNLAGPVALFAVFWLFYNRPARCDISKLVWIGLGPLAGVAAAAFWYMQSLEEVRFRSESSFAASGGFGPNQVASALSLGIVLLVAVLWLRAGSVRSLWVWGLLGFLLVQTLLTFSRAGVAMALGAVVTMSLILIRSRRFRLTVVVFALMAFLIADRLLIPWLNRYTKGAFVERYTDPRLSNRDVIAKTDIQMFLENPIFGVGLGMGTELREALMGARIAAHTEFTRILGEHGLVGGISMIALFLMLLNLVRRAPPGGARAMVAGLLVWAWLYFAVNAFRLVLPVAALALACLLAAPKTWKQLQNGTRSRRSWTISKRGA